MNLIGDFHIHTIASGDAFGTIREVVQVAIEKDLKCIAITEHGPKMEASAHDYYFKSLIDNVQSDSGLIIYPGVEANIVDCEGSMDLPESIINQLKFVIASFHPFSWKDKGKILNTKALKKCLLKYNVKSIAHLNYPYYSIDIDEIIPVLLEKKTAIEINNRALAKDEENWERFKDMVLSCSKQGVKFLVNSDAHYPLQVGEFDNGLRFAEYCGLTEDDILNTDFRKIKDYFNLGDEEI
ncbi:PHP domain-containing protein [Sporosalibacterium faouarense]|uniref:PHP domain-containing protein n=1 Tax=Sporosalibacterium faouarense TaxID=516123 RepID=UPI00192B4B5D|nr:PHP domain-containing protein [Sporosalibacterium faouarense]